jgi:SAM-dependent methyltransferase
MTTFSPDHARDAYEAMASSYDSFNHRYMYERWTGRLLACAERAGLAGTKLLDVACGTGLTMLLPLARGMEVSGCDISPAMLAQARAKVGPRVELIEGDMRALPDLGEFDLIWSVDDSLNYLTSVAELEATLAGIARNLAPAGVVVFDLNTTECYRGFWSEETTVDHGGRRFVWRGNGDATAVEPGGTFEASLEIDGHPGPIHRQRHFPLDETLASIAAAGLDAVDVYGETGGDLRQPLDEGLHTKAVYVCRSRDRRRLAPCPTGTAFTTRSTAGRSERQGRWQQETCTPSIRTATG